MKHLFLFQGFLIIETTFSRNVRKSNASEIYLLKKNQKYYEILTIYEYFKKLFMNIGFIDATDISNITSDQKRFFSIPPLIYLQTLPLNFLSMVYSFKLRLKIEKIFVSRQSGRPLYQYNEDDIRFRF